jgi:hypothetical protein
VTLAKGDNVLRGQYGVVDLNKNVSHLLAQPPSVNATEGQSAQVYGTLEPRPKPPRPEPAPKAPAQ